MADTVTTQTIISGSRNLVMKFTNESDGTGESAVTKVANTALTIHGKIARIIYNVQGGSVRVMWNSNTPTDAAILSYAGTMDYTFEGGLTNPNNAGADGAINFTTVGFSSGSSYTITLEMIKGI